MTAGDEILIPAGVPHQITAANGEVQFLPAEHIPDMEV
jgi:uncharacterized RmlC-like cupin family protein